MTTFRVQLKLLISNTMFVPMSTVALRMYVLRQYHSYSYSTVWYSEVLMVDGTNNALTTLPCFSVYRYMVPLYLCRPYDEA